MLAEARSQGAKRTWVDHRVWIGDHDELDRRIARGNAPIDPGPETEVGASGDDRHLGSQRPERRRARPRYAVLDDDEGAHSVGSERHDAVEEEGSDVVVDDDRCHSSASAIFRAGRHAQSVVVKRNLTSALRAAKPSRQVIFFPSSASRPW